MSADVAIVGAGVVVGLGGVVVGLVPRFGLMFGLIFGISKSGIL
jgi:hypothetical protein